MLDNISDVFESFGEYNSHVCILVTHWDLITEKGADATAKEMTEVKKVFAEYGIDKVHIQHPKAFSRWFR